MKNNFYTFDVSIIGAGPSGLTCAIYASRGNLNVCFIDKGAPGGKMTKTFQIENWTGDEQVKGYELSLRMFNHAKSVGAKHIFANVTNIETKSEQEHYIHLENGTTIQTKAIVIATGMNNKIPEINNIEHFEHKGVSYCVVCDASLYKNKPAAIIGGGDSAFEEAIYLSSIASKVYLFIRKPQARAEKRIVAEVEKISNIEIHYNSTVIDLIGDKYLEKVKYIQDGEEHIVEVNHLYPYIGYIPANTFAKDLPIFDQSGFIITNEFMETQVPGIYAIGDIRKKNIRQIITAANDGAIAGKTIVNRIREK